jgi:hypothetical protein
MALYQHQDVVDTPVGRTERVTRSHRFSPGQFLGGAVGIVLVLFGIVAVTRTGVDSTLNTPPTQIMGLTQSALIGLVELGVGLLLILSAADIAFRGFMGFLGALLVVGGVVVAAATNKMLLDLGTLHSTGWFAVVMGAIAIFAATLPSFLRTDQTVRSDIR